MNEEREGFEDSVLVTVCTNFTKCPSIITVLYIISSCSLAVCLYIR
jgi:hypothetical protein